MKKFIQFTAITMLLMAGAGQAQTWSDEQSEVWGVVLASYVDADNKDPNWVEKWVTEDALVWGSAYPMPRSRDSSKRWNNYQMPLSENLLSEYSPVGIVVHDSTAVAHYYYSSAAKNTAGKHKTTHGRCSDVLAKGKNGWKFVSWHCSDTPSSD